MTPWPPSRVPLVTASSRPNAGTTAPAGSTSILRSPPVMSFTFLAKSSAYSWKMSFAGHVLCQRMLIGPCALTTAGKPSVAPAVAAAAPARNFRRASRLVLLDSCALLMNVLLRCRSLIGARRVAAAYLAQQLGVVGYSAVPALLRRGTRGTPAAKPANGSPEPPSSQAVAVTFRLTEQARPAPSLPAARLLVSTRAWGSDATQSRQASRGTRPRTRR